MEPVDIGRYEFIRLPVKERWGVLVRGDSPLAGKDRVTAQDLKNVPLLIGQRALVQNELANWFGDIYEKVEIASTFNLILNAANMVKNGLGAAMCFSLDISYDNLKFIPLFPELETGSVVAWKKNQIFSKAAAAFIDYIRNTM